MKGNIQKILFLQTCPLEIELIEPTNRFESVRSVLCNFFKSIFLLSLRLCVPSVACYKCMCQNLTAVIYVGRYLSNMIRKGIKNCLLKFWKKRPFWCMEIKYLDVLQET